MYSLLPPANEVWGKVIFSQASVILSGGRGVVASQHASQITSPGRSTSRGGLPRGVCIQEGVCLQGGSAGGWADPLPRYTGYYGIRSTSGQYASYWNAFL